MYLIWGIIILLLAGNTLAKEKIVRVSTLIDYAPFCMKLSDDIEYRQTIPVGGQAKGFGGYSWEVLKESFHKMGYTIDLSIVPWIRGMEDLKTGNTDILFPTVKNQERLKLFNYSKESINRSKFLIYVSKNSNIKWRNLDSLKGLNIAARRGFSYGDKWDSAPYIKKYKLDTILQAFKMLDNKRVDGVVGYEESWDYILKQEKIAFKYKKLPFFDFAIEYLAALKKNPDGQKFLNIFDQGKRKLIKEKKLDQIKTKWLLNSKKR